MITVKFIKHVHSCFASVASTDVWLEHTLELPFMPPVGMTVVDGDFEATVTEVSYENGQAIAYTEPNKAIYEAAFRSKDVFGVVKDESGRTIDDIVREYVQCGWKERKRG